jgi:hypothetical protein
MPMPSLLKYFAFVGAALFGLLSLVNFLLDPSTGATPVATSPAKQTVAVQHDPRASKIERWRDDQAALSAAPQIQTSKSASLVTKSVAAAPKSAESAQSADRSKLATPLTTATIRDVKPQGPQLEGPQLAAVASEPQPATPAATPAPAPETPAIVGAESTDEIAATQAAKVAERKAKAAKARARKERVARQRDTTRERYASSQQDQFYYGQRGGQQPFFATRYSSAFAPQQQSFGPFNNGGWGRAW